MLVEQKAKVQVDRWRIAPHVIDLENSILREILKISSQPGVINFAGGLPAPELFPLEPLKKIMAEVIDIYGPDCLQYSLSRGITAFRELIAERATNAGTETSIENILVTSGSQQGLDITARAFLDPNDCVLTEYPTYVGALQVLNFYQASCVSIGMDDQGILTDQLISKIKKHNPKFIYTVSNFQNPTGITMSLERRKQLIEIATEYGVPIVDDNPYGDIRFDGDKIPSLKSLGGDQVIALRSFSKVLSPGFRLGWINGPAAIMGQFEKVKQCVDLHTTSYLQYVTYEFLKRGLLEPHVEKIKNDYRTKRDVMLREIQKTFPEGTKWTRPEGGLFIWVELPKHISAKELLPEAIKRKVAYVYGEPFFPDGLGQNTLRLNFATSPEEKIIEGIGRLGQLLSEQM